MHDAIFSPTQRALERKRKRRRERAKKRGPQGVALAEGAHYGCATAHKGGLALQPQELVLQVRLCVCVCVHVSVGVFL